MFCLKLHSTTQTRLGHLPKRPFQHFTKYCFFLWGFCFFALVSTSFTTLRSLCFFETSRLVRFNPTLFAFPEQRCQNIKGMYFSQRQLVQNNTEKRSHGSYQVVENSREKHSKYIQMVEKKHFEINVHGTSHVEKENIIRVWFSRWKWNHQKRKELIKWESTRWQFFAQCNTLQQQQICSDIGILLIIDHGMNCETWF